MTDADDLLGLRGKVALVTGAARSIGRGCALELARAGCDVAVVDVADGSSTADAVAELGRNAFVVEADVLDAGAVDRAVNDAAERLGGLDVAVNTVGGTHAPKPFLDLTVEEWHEVVDRNALATFLCCRSEAAWMVGHGVTGSIVNIASLSGVAGAPNAADYGAANAAVVHLTASLALELAPRGIRVNCIAPGAHWTETTREAAASPDPQLRAWVAATEAATPLGRLGDVREAGGVAVFLASRLSSYVTGQTIVSDGGLVHTTARPPLGRASATGNR
ncbi:MAG TPA: SDR family NAD(P)-dependent oxidoreductase [Acidimicrobiia bacterium]|nr:SDR family NAD(P)-dependent oxidoreductase [Acidimicrobiia bacterium]